MKYEELRAKAKKRYGWDEAKLERVIRMGKMWHNPLNYSDGHDIKKEVGWDVLFTDLLPYRNGRKEHRFYFPFHKYSEDLTDPDKVMKLFLKSKNWKRYYKLWNEYAPESVKSEAMYLLVVVDMTVSGFKHEKKVIDDIRATGAEVRLSTPAEDLAGVDVWVDGEPVQIKSPATQRRIDNG